MDLSELIMNIQQLAPQLASTCCAINGAFMTLEDVEKMGYDEFLYRSKINMPLRLYKYFSNTENDKEGSKVNYSMIALKNNTVYMQSPSLFDDVYDSEIICSFIFTYKRIEYIVLVKRFVGTEKRINEYALVKLHFIKSKNLDDDLQVEANSSGMLIDARQLREYFEIEYNENLGDILQEFIERLGTFVPTSIPNNVSEIEKNAMIQSLSKSDSEDPSKIYCNKVRRNPNNGHRSEFNADKTKLLRPALYTYFSNDESISFCFYSDEAMENDDETILRNFSSR